MEEGYMSRPQGGRKASLLKKAQLNQKGAKEDVWKWENSM